MLSALLVFLIGCLVLCMVLYVTHLVMGYITLPEPIKQIALCIVGLIGIVVLLMLAIQVFQQGFGVIRW